ncbi:transcription intermediary factor 1-alpha-like [Mercenaria mercenaria]|uniref:transcription intermediary factor 1-alpha-like n=1 Tax=Mercenaria mercenaria TaxID=6596 RepID=UPI00234E80FE|nr:transcription intermediary factor 1-alpha-like [Mercenaria mercenaria]
MATSSENTGSDIDATGAMNCDFCTMKPAEGYCTDCLEYLCDECFRNHCKPKPCRNHKLVGKDKMPRRQVSTAVVDNKCDCNANNNVNFYCERHHKLLCVNCIVNIHKGCRFRDLTERSTHTEKSEEYSEFLKELDESENMFEVKKGLSQQHKDKCNESFKQVFQKA